MWKELSQELEKTTEGTARGLVHVGGRDIAGRTGVIWADGVVVTLARHAREGESVPVVVPGGAEAQGTVHAWDPRTGLAVLRVAGVSDPHWSTAQVPRVGSLVLAVAFPSPQGPEARLDVVRFAGSSTEWARGVALEGFFQTDGAAFPGFTGAVVVDADGALVGFVAENQSGNGSFVVSAPDLVRLVGPLVKTGSPQQAWLGVSTRPAGGQGLSLIGVDAGGPADQAGWKAGDLLLSVGGRGLRTPGDLVQVLATLEPGKVVAARLLREGEVHDWPVTPTSRR